MKLADFFARMAPYLEGRHSHAEAVRVLYPGREDSKDARRLSIYGEFCHTHRHEALSVYEHCRAAVLRELGQEALEDLAARYFQAHPMRSFELNENGARFPEFLRGPGPGIPPLPYLPDLADFEWWEWQVLVQPDDPADAGPEKGPLRLGATVELRRYGYDLLDWIDERGLEGAPAEREGLVLFWRDLDGDGRRGPASAAELRVLQQVSAGQAPEDEETLADLRAAGIILGDRTPGARRRRSTAPRAGR